MNNSHTENEHELANELLDEQEIPTRNEFSKYLGYLLLLVEAILFLQLIILFFGKGNGTIVSFISTLAHPLYAPFLYIFSSSVINSFRIEASVLSALALYYLGGLLIISLVRITLDRLTIHTVALR